MGSLRYRLSTVVSNMSCNLLLNYIYKKIGSLRDIAFQATLKEMFRQKFGRGTTFMLGFSFNCP